ncbi:MAG TPA: hypothetical protein PL041_01090 [Melioribacteraceae bacterium]|nr:hypothetical protein [Melioribacteraceae bacterium]
MELKDAIFTTLQIFTVLMIVILTVSYISFKIKKKKSGNLEPYQIEPVKEEKPKLAVKTSIKDSTSSKKESKDEVKLLSLQDLREKEKEKQKERQKNQEKERQRNKEKLKTERKKEKSRNKESRTDEHLKEAKSISRENRFQILNSASNEEQPEGKVYSRPLAPLRPYDSKSDNNTENLFDRYTNDDDDDLFSPKIPTKKR